MGERMKRIYPLYESDTSDEMIEASILENVCESCLHRENDDCKLVDSGLIPRNARVWDCDLYERAK